jgi:copper resistance protein B
MKMPLSAVALLLASTSVPALAQEMDHSHINHEAMEETGEPEPGEDHSAYQAPAEVPAASDPHAGHSMPATDDAIPGGNAPPVPADHAAEAFYSSVEMAWARAAMLKESGGMIFSQVMLDRLEYRLGKGADGYHWEGEGWFGGDTNRLAFKTEGEGEIDGGLESAEVQALYSRAIDPWFWKRAFGMISVLIPTEPMPLSVSKGLPLIGSKSARRLFYPPRATHICGWRRAMTNASRSG